MASKGGKGEYPEKSGPNDFECFGPPAIKDGEFENVMIADMGCFTQDGKDTNKFYHGAVVQHKTSKKWYAYFEWGRVGNRPDFQFMECSSKEDAQKEFAKQLHSKNDKRGQWATIAGIKTLQAKPGKDCYLVRPLETRSTGLPDATKIKTNESPRPKTTLQATATEISIDKYSLQLLRDLNVGTVAYTKGSMADKSIPTQTAIDEGRQILQEAKKRLIVVGDQVDNQVGDKDLQEMTRILYSRIPKIKERNASPETWILSQSNIFRWEQDLDAFEGALNAVSSEEPDQIHNPYGGLPIRLEWIDPQSLIGKFLYAWWPKATKNRHSVGNMKINNAWKINREGDDEKILKYQKFVANEKFVSESPILQPSDRPDVKDAELFKKTNTALLFHGTRSVNVRGIMDKGLMLPKQLVGVVITGAMFGPGLYFADDWKKSAGYTSLRSSYWSNGGGAIKGRNAFMFACNVVLGNAHVASGPRGYTTPPTGKHSVFGKAGHSQVQNNEWIVYTSNQNSLEYLVEFAA